MCHARKQQRPNHGKRALLRSLGNGRNQGIVNIAYVRNVGAFLDGNLRIARHPQRAAHRGTARNINRACRHIHITRIRASQVHRSRSKSRTLVGSRYTHIRTSSIHTARRNVGCDRHILARNGDVVPHRRRRNVDGLACRTQATVNSRRSHIERTASQQSAATGSATYFKAPSVKRVPHPI